eukprot:1159164-Pelagomonas_calceolata.AAC.5
METGAIQMSQTCWGFKEREAPRQVARETNTIVARDTQASSETPRQEAKDTQASSETPRQVARHPGKWRQTPTGK